MKTPIPTNTASFSLGEIAEATGGTTATPNVVVRGVVIDSRQVATENLFVALRGARRDGHEFVADVVARGASAVLVETSAPGIPHVLVPDTEGALAALAAFHRRRFPGRVIAITGSAGKTSTKEMVAAAWSGIAEVVRTRGNMNNRIGTALSVLQLHEKASGGVFELGTNAPGEIAKLAALTQPDVAIVTLIGSAHAAGLGDHAGIVQEKLSLLRALGERGVAIVRDEVAALPAFREAVGARRWLSFGSAGKLTFVRGPRGPQTQCRVRAGAAVVDLRLASLGAGSALAAAAALAAAQLEEWGDIRHALEGVPPVPGRVCPVATPRLALLLDDAYNANPASMRAGLETLVGLRRVYGGRAIAVLGEMAELGDLEAEAHAQVLRDAECLGVDRLVLCGSAFERARSATSLPVVCTPDAASCLDALPELRRTDLVLVKGSRSAGLDVVVDALA
ncbi:MAG: UDP-N-acetylmuramoyl-tripeptide--D-alanyl-D-alanine ligase [Myxococcota bacterium]